MREFVTVAVLFARRDSVYKTLPDVDVWDEDRDALKFSGPGPVVAHPPCKRWGRYWGGAPSTFPRLKLGDDGGCFAFALGAVRRWGGVIEHPEGSHAWRAFALNLPPRAGAWIAADFEGGWTCCIEQGHFGHMARKATWLYAHGIDVPSAPWGKAAGDFVCMDIGYHSKEERARAIKTSACQRLSHAQREHTPIEFAKWLLEVAKRCSPPSSPKP